MIDKGLIAGIKNGDSKALSHVYKAYRSDFINFGLKYKLRKTELLDIYQDAIIALRNNAVEGKIDDLKSELKTYLFSIAKYMIYARLKAMRKLRIVDDTSIFENQAKVSVEYDIIDDLTVEQKQLKAAFDQLGPKCKSILTLFYYRGYDLDEIGKTMHYTNTDVVKSQKSRCLRTLKSLIFKS